MNKGLKLYLYQNNSLFKKIALATNHSHNVIIGTGKNTTVKLNNKLISSQHAQFIFDNKGHLHIQDLKSTNGTFLNGEKLTPSIAHMVKPKDTIQLASTNGILIVVEEIKNDSFIENKINIVEKLKLNSKVIIGRAKECDIFLNSDSVSRKHAEVSKNSNGDYFIKDLNSLNGTFVNGSKIKGVIKISLSDRIFIGKLQLSLEGTAKDLSEELAICTKGIQKIFPNGKKILNKIDLAIPSKSLLAIMGPSGCGKTTLLRTLNGEGPATNGKVFLFGQELISNYEYLKTKIGYVPQYDSIHTELTVRQSLYYTAKMRLDNLSDQEIHKKIDDLLNELAVGHVSENKISKISGGQKKRVCIAQELLSQLPLYLI